MTIATDSSDSPQSGHRFGLAVIVIIVSIFLFDIQGSIVKHLGDRYPVAQITLFRNLFGLFPSLLVLLLSAEWHAQGRKIQIRQWRLACVRGATLVFAQLCFYFSLTRMELATATTLAFAGPLFVTTLSIPILGHSVGIWRGLAVLLGFAGVVLVMRPGSAVFSLWVFLPVGAAFFYALTSVSARLFDASVPTALINLYTGTTTLVGSALIMMLTTGFHPVSSLTDWLWLIAMGTAGGFAVLLMITAYRMAEPSSLSPFEYFGIPFSFILGWYFFAESPFDRLFPGVLFIVSGGLLVLWREKQLARKITD